MEASIITTYRCPMRCSMCSIWESPTDQKNEFAPDLLKKLPALRLVNVTGGEPFIREDLDEIVSILFTRSKRVVISTSGWYEERVLALAARFPSLGFRVSLEGLSQTNDQLRGRPSGFDRGLRLLLSLRRIGVRDIGFGITASNDNSNDMLSLYELAKQLRMEFATAAVHNSFYFHRFDNRIDNKAEVSANFEELANRLIREPSPKSWFRAYFNLGLANYVRGGPRLLPCEAGTENFFVDPSGEVLPCNGMDQPDSMGNLREAASFDELWLSERAQAVRRRVLECPKNCWMIGSVSPVMKKYLGHTATWVLKNKLRSLALGRRPLLGCPERPGEQSTTGDSERGIATQRSGQREK